MNKVMVGGVAFVAVAAVGIFALTLSSNNADAPKKVKVAPADVPEGKGAEADKGAAKKNTNDAKAPGSPNAKPAQAAANKANPTAAAKGNATGNPSGNAGAAADTNNPGAGSGSGAAQNNGAAPDANKPTAIRDEGKPAGVNEPQNPLNQALVGLAIPSVMMCLKERTDRGESYKGTLDFTSIVTLADGEPNKARIELSSIDGNDLGKTDLDCVRSSFEDQLLDIDKPDLQKELGTTGQAEVKFNVSIEVKGKSQP